MKIDQSLLSILMNLNYQINSLFFWTLTIFIVGMNGLCYSQKYSISVNDYDEGHYKELAGSNYYLLYFLTKKEERKILKVRKQLSPGNYKLVFSESLIESDLFKFDLNSPQPLKIQNKNKSVVEFENSFNQPVTFNFDNYPSLNIQDALAVLFVEYSPSFSMPIPNFSFKDIDGQIHSKTILEPYSLTILFLWNSEHDFSTNTVNTLNEIKAKYDNKINIISISAHQIERLKYLKKTRMAKFMMTSADLGTIAKFKQGKIFPILQFILVDQEKTLFWHIGDHYKLSKSLDQAIINFTD